MRICILGAGVIGLTTAWALAEEGHDVTIVDRNAEPGAETSSGNGAQLSYAYVAPLASPSILAKIPGLLLDPSGPLRIKPQLSLDFIRWGLEFLGACNAKTERETTRAQLALAALSRLELERLTTGLQLDFGLRAAGKLIVTRDAKTFQSLQNTSTQLQAIGIEQKILSPSECLAEEPTLQIQETALAGGVLSPTEQVGDCAKFCEELSQHLARRNTVKWLMNTPVTQPILRDGKMSAVETSQGDVTADVFVLSLGSYSHLFSRKAGLRLPVYPMKGYSFTSRLRQGALRHSVTDLDNKVVFAPLGEGDAAPVRVAGIADLVGYDASINATRFDRMKTAAAKTFDLDTDGPLEPWAGLRPATPDSRPIIGWSPIPGLFVNTGHGALGWTLACGSARLAADLLTGKHASVTASWFSLER